MDFHDPGYLILDEVEGRRPRTTPEASRVHQGTVGAPGLDSETWETTNLRALFRALIKLE